MTQPRLTVVPITLAQANAYVDLLHRHNGRLPSAKFAVAVVDDSRAVRGVGVAGLPKARMLSNGFTIEINRVCTDGTPNACSALYGACIRAAKAMGYCRVVTYVLNSEPGTSLRAAGMGRAGDAGGGSWKGRNNNKGQASYVDGHDTGPKVRWEIEWKRPATPVSWPDALTVVPPPSLFGATA